MMMNPDKPVCGSNGDCIIGFGLSKYLMGHSAYFNTAVTKQDFMEILGVSS